MGLNYKFLFRMTNIALDEKQIADINVILTSAKMPHA